MFELCNLSVKIVQIEPGVLNFLTFSCFLNFSAHGEFTVNIYIKADFTAINSIYENSNCYLI